MRDRESATGIASQLGGMLLGLLKTMPDNGWIVVASVLADIRSRCLAHQLAQEGLAREMTQEPVRRLSQALSADDRKRILAAPARPSLHGSRRSGQQRTERCRFYSPAGEPGRP